jgi:uncharacterized membrane protein YfcA
MFLGLTYETLGVLWLGALLGGIAAGGSGFAFALAASSIWLHRINPLHVAIMSTGCGVVLHLSTIWPQRRHIELGRLWPFVAGGLAGVPIGVYFLAYTDARVLKISLGVFLILFGIYTLIVPQLPDIASSGHLADAAVGFVGGILGGIGGCRPCCSELGSVGKFTAD